MAGGDSCGIRTTCEFYISNGEASGFLTKVSVATCSWLCHGLCPLASIHPSHIFILFISSFSSCIVITGMTGIARRSTSVRSAEVSSDEIDSGVLQVWRGLGEVQAACTIHDISVHLLKCGMHACNGFARLWRRATSLDILRLYHQASQRPVNASLIENIT